MSQCYNAPAMNETQKEIAGLIDKINTLKTELEDAISYLEDSDLESAVQDYIDAIDTAEYDFDNATGLLTELWK